jgi:hypothetical protein
MKINKVIKLTLSSPLLIVVFVPYSAVAAARTGALPRNPGCDVAFGNVQMGAYWQPSNGDVGGIRAPINLRRDWELCTDSNDDDFMAVWIAIEQGTFNGNATGITQAGWIHERNGNGTASEDCRFWAIGIGVSNAYDCTDSDNTTVYFRIDTYSAPGGDLFYNVDDCGTAGNFDNCTNKSASQDAYSSAFASPTSEVVHPCQSVMLGSPGDTVDYGNDNWGVVGNNGSGWDIRSWTAFNQGCTADYKMNLSGDQMQTWDTRNTS